MEVGNNSSGCGGGVGWACGSGGVGMRFLLGASLCLVARAGNFLFLLPSIVGVGR